MYGSKFISKGHLNEMGGKSNKQFFGAFKKIFHQTENIHDFVVISFVKHSGVIYNKYMYCIICLLL